MGRVKHRLLRAGTEEKISQHNHIAKQRVSDRARAAFHRHYSKPEVFCSVRQAQPCIMRCKKVCVHQGRGARYSGRGCTLGLWQQTRQTARQHYYRAQRALSTIKALFVYTYRRRMGMIPHIDPLV